MKNKGAVEEFLQVAEALPGALVEMPAARVECGFQREAPRPFLRLSE